MFAWDMSEIISSESNLIPQGLRYDSVTNLFKDTNNIEYVFNNYSNGFYKITGLVKPTVGANAFFDDKTKLYHDENKLWVFNQILYKMMEVWPNQVIYTSDSQPTPTPTTGQIRIKVLLDGQPVDATGIVLHMQSPGLITPPTARDIPAAGSTYQKPIGNNLLIFDGGTPAGTEFIDIQPLGTQTVVADRETVWTLNFKTKVNIGVMGCPDGQHVENGVCVRDVIAPIPPTPAPTPAPTPVSSNNTGLLLAAVAGAYFLFFKKNKSQGE